MLITRLLPNSARLLLNCRAYELVGLTFGCIFLLPANNAFPASANKSYDLIFFFADH
jgi:hypothetical protein